MNRSKSWRVSKTLSACTRTHIHSDLFGPSPHSSSSVQMRKELDLTGAGGWGAGRLDDSGSHWCCAKYDQAEPLPSTQPSARPQTGSLKHSAVGTQIGRSKWALTISGIITWVVGHRGERRYFGSLNGHEVRFNLEEQAVHTDSYCREASKGECIDGNDHTNLYL